jgi:uncharacterized protein (DUF2237 family)
LNIFGEKLVACGLEPMTGYFRDGCCRTDESDEGRHTVCAQMNEAFLDFSKNCGNDLTAARPEWGFPGLKPGDRWCICVDRWIEAYEAAAAPAVFLHSTHQNVLEFIPLEILQNFSAEPVRQFSKPKLRLIQGGLSLPS